MNETTAELIKSLAEQLGTTVEMLWGVLLAQAPITGSIQLAICLGMVAATGGITWLVYRKTTLPWGSPKRDKDGWRISPPWEEGAPLAWFAVFLAVMITALASADMATSIAAAFFNPEYWALQEILKAR